LFDPGALSARQKTVCDETSSPTGFARQRGRFTTLAGTLKSSGKRVLITAVLRWSNWSLLARLLDAAGAEAFLSRRLAA
jgi:hypothetical protein